ncbi:hypothetical protein KAFR_0C04500 [Kazachstania africana CBS 2517]|uniref:Uncharacterized protein n=1 Tax=Kazachstania africana (strain ATCC 22294 / BCRC 22015 / CBS 2517 / CECT 1963 / NBRC 1671 / NRRL Y-8276) TaxID=1071382 RepID=H2ASU1_KAZAF|nr:hypothetical protein KAFR_0C04500 [Kazachstania africana CBS 2517]CCF57441.1 hypothetical protein KAFR_0C04500 [Kazachstania africana CBS 2517]
MLPTFHQYIKRRIALAMGLQGITIFILFLCTLTTPVLKNSGLAEYNGTVYGVYGYSKLQKDYEPSSVVSMFAPVYKSESSGWLISSFSREYLSNLMVLFPILTVYSLLIFLTSFITLLVALYHSQSLNGLRKIIFINTLCFTFAFLLSVMTCIEIFLLFMPHVTIFSWLTLVLPLVWYVNKLQLSKSIIFLDEMETAFNNIHK